jgi:hypothetical protein
MKKGLAIVLMAVVFISLGGVGSVWAADAAMVVEILRGEAQYGGGAKEGQGVQLMDFLSSGDVITLLPDTVIVLNYLDSGNREQVTGPGRITVGPTASEAQEGATIESSKAAFTPPPSLISSPGGGQFGAVTLRGTGIASTQTTRPAMVDPMKQRLDQYKIDCIGPDKVAVLNLYQTASLSRRPVFKWAAAPGARNYIFTLFDSSGQKLMEEFPIANQFEVPAPGLVAGTRYRWSIQAMAGDKEIASSWSEFWVLTDEQKQKVEADEKKIKAGGGDSTEQQIALTYMYQFNKLYDLAAEAMRGLASKYPKNENIAGKLAKLDPTAGVTQ